GQQSQYGLAVEPRNRNRRNPIVWGLQGSREVSRRIVVNNRGNGACGHGVGHFVGEIQCSARDERNVIAHTSRKVTGETETAVVNLAADTSGQAGEVQRIGEVRCRSQLYESGSLKHT